MNELVIFAGIGGGILASQLVGNRIVCAIEKDPYAQSVLVQRQNDGCLDPFPIWDDAETFDGERWKGLVELVSAGFPCQPFSSASTTGAKADDLWWMAERIVSSVSPNFVFLENVSKKAFSRPIEALHGMGFRTVGMSLSAKDLGGDHIRNRHWLLAYTDDYSKLHTALYATDVAFLSRVCESVWKTFDYDSRMDDGAANRVVRYRTVGNAQVPTVAAVAYVTLLKLAKEDLESELQTLSRR